MTISSFFQQIKSKAARKQPAQLEAPTLECVALLPHGPFRFQTQVPEEFEYEIEATTNLKTWASIFSSRSNGKIDFADPDAPKFRHRFYRLNLKGEYSRDIIGYATVTVPPGFSLIANPLSGVDESVAELFKGMPDGTGLSKFDNRLHRLTQNALEAGKWTNPTETLGLGEGALLFNPTSEYKKLRFAGRVCQSGFSTLIPAGFSMQSSVQPQPGRLDTELGFPIGDGDVIHLLDTDTQKYVLYPYEGSAWKCEAPVLGVGEAFWVEKKAPSNWHQQSSIPKATSWIGMTDDETKQAPGRKNHQ